MSAERPPSTEASAHREWLGLGPLDAPDVGPCRIEGESFAERLERRTRALIGAEYRLSPLGEGVLPDDDPRIRFDAFDCTTFVEMALALSRCDDRSIIERLDAIRYDGAPRFDRRRHLAVSQWVNGLVQDGWLVPAPAAPTEDRIELRLDRDRWTHRRIATDLHLPAERVPRGTFVVRYLRLDDAAATLAERSTPAIINVVREDRPAVPDVVTHQALVLRVSGAPRVRHASTVTQRVREESVDRFVRRFQSQRKWPVVGFQVLEFTTDAAPPDAWRASR